MNDKLRRRAVRFVAVVATVAAMLACGGYLYRTLDLPGERLGSMPSGSLENLVWHGEYLYFLYEPNHIDSTNELWRVKPGGRAEPVGREELEASVCPGGYYLALAERSDGDLVLLRECDYSIEVVALRVEMPGSLSVTLTEASDGKMHMVVSRIAFVGDVVFASEDGYRCSGVGRIDGKAIVSMPPLATADGPLDLGRNFGRRAEDECVDFPPAGFVTPVGNSVAVLASVDAIGMVAEKLDSAEWTIYRTTINWDSGLRLADGFEQPAEMAPLKDCGLLIAARRGRSDAIWLVGADGGVERVLDGEYSTFAVRPDGGAVAVLPRDGDAESLRLVRQPFKGKPICDSDVRF